MNYIHLQKSRSRGYWRILHTQTNTLIATVKGKKEAKALSMALEGTCNLNFNQEDIEQGNYPAKEMLDLIQPYQEASLKEILSKVKLVKGGRS